MIVPMKKVSLVTIKRLENETLDSLREIGVLHVHQTPGSDDNGDRLREQVGRLQRALAIVQTDDASKPDSSRDPGASVDKALSIATEIEQLVEQQSQLLESRDRITREIERMEPWGEIAPAMLAALAEKNVQIRLYALTPDVLERVELPRYIILNRTKSVVRLISVVTGDDTFPADVDFFPIAEAPLSELRHQIDETDRELAGIESLLAGYSADVPTFLAAMEELSAALEYAGVQSTVDSDEELSWLTGFLPADRLDSVKEGARQNGWGLVIDDPAETDPVPTEVRNPKPVQIIRPVFQLLGTVPGYREFDISVLFLLFLTVFFAMIIGDGGYGAIILVGTLYGAIKTKLRGAKLGEGQLLLLVFSFATVAWGAVTGNWFGYAPFAQLPVLRDLVVPRLDAASEISPYWVQYMCFILGTIHLSIAHLWGFVRALQNRPRIVALAQLGWLSLVLGLYYLVLQLVLDPSLTMPAWAVPMIAGGLGSVIVFGSQEQGTNFFVGIAKGFANIITTVLDGVSAFSDIISYIRLYAVGLASLAIAQAFNEMGAGIGSGLDGVVGIVAAALVLALGHTLNLAMGALSVVVHGVRLNMLEFSGHLGMEWTGVQYAPFKSRGKQGEVA